MHRVRALPARPPRARWSCISSCARIRWHIEMGGPEMAPHTPPGARRAPAKPWRASICRPFRRCHPRSYAEGEAGGRGEAFDPERDVPDAFGVDIGAEEPVPDRQAGPEIGTMMLREIAVMDVVVAGRHEDPLQPSRAPRHVHVHPVILEEAFREDQ